MRCEGVAVMDPVVISSDVINESTPVSIDDTCHDGFQVVGWKSDMEKQSRVLQTNRPIGSQFLHHPLWILLPLGVVMRIAGGANGYCVVNVRVPMYCPPASN